MAASVLEYQLLKSAKINDMAALVSSLNCISTSEKATINPEVIDAVVESIVRHSKLDRVEFAYTTMVMVRSIGAYMRPAAIKSLLEALPSTPAERAREAKAFA